MGDGTPELRFNCSKCGQHLTADPGLAGQQMACPHCREQLTVPGLGGEEWQPGQVLEGLYEVQRRLGQGGMGTVWLVQHRKWGIFLAVKSPTREGIELAGGLERYVREAETWVKLRLHPHVVQAFYVRELAGVPRIFAEYCPGGSVAEWLEREERLEVAQALDWGIQICWGVAHAHQEGLIHCDLKPGNVLLGGEGLLKVTDFGLARSGQRVVSEGGGAGVAAKVSLGFGTPEYAAPEQTRTGATVDARADVFAFGVTLWELLGGPLIWKERTVVAERSVAKLLASGEPPGLPAELGPVILRCLAAQPELRWESMAAVAAELRRLFREVTGGEYRRPEPQAAEFVADTLNNQALSLLDLGQEEEAVRLLKEAGRQQPGHREATFNLGLWRWRHGEQTDEALVASLGPPEWRELRAAVHLERGDAVSAAADGAKVAADAGTGRFGQWALANEQVTALAFAPDGQSLFVGTRLGNLYSVDVRDRQAPPRRLWGREQERAVRLIRVLRDGRVAVVFERGLVVIWEPARGDAQRELRAARSLLHGTHISDDGLLLVANDLGNVLGAPLSAPPPEAIRLEWAYCRAAAVATLAEDRALLLAHERLLEGFELQTGRLLGRAECETPATCLAVAPTGGRVVTGHANGELVLWAAPAVRRQRGLVGHRKAVRGVGWIAPTTIVSAGDDGAVCLWDAASGVCRRTLAASGTLAGMAVTPDGSLLAAGGTEGVVWVWRGASESLGPAGYLMAHPRSAAVVTEAGGQFRRGLAEADDAVSPAERYRRLRATMATAGYERAPAAMRALGDLARQGRLVQLRDAWERGDLADSQTAAHAAVISADGRQAWSAGGDRIRRWWDLEHGAAAGTFDVTGAAITTLTMSADRRQLALGDAAGGVRVYDLASGQRVLEARATAHPVAALAFPSAGGWLVVADDHGELASIGLAQGQVWSLKQDDRGGVLCLAAAPVGVVVAGGGRGGEVALWAPNRARPLWRLARRGAEVRAVCFSPGGGYLAAGDVTGAVTLWRLATGEPAVRWQTKEAPVVQLSFLGEGRFVVVGCSTGEVTVWELAAAEAALTAQQVGRLALQSGTLETLALAEGGTLGLAATGPSGLSVVELDWELELPEVAGAPPPGGRQQWLPDDVPWHQVLTVREWLADIQRLPGMLELWWQQHCRHAAAAAAVLIVLGVLVAMGIWGWHAGGQTRYDRWRGQAAYQSAMTEARQFLSDRRWEAAETAAGKALNVQGYGDDEAARKLRAQAQAGLLAQQADALAQQAGQAKERTDWAAVSRLAEQALAKLPEHQTAKTLKAEAAQHLAPWLTIVATLGGRPVDGATVEVVDEVGGRHAAGKLRTPCVVALEKGHTYQITVKPAPGSALGFCLAETRYRAERNGPQQCEAKLKEGYPVAGQDWTVPELGLPMVWVAPGSFQMGSTAGENDEKPVHQVRLTKGYWLGKYEVTQGEWTAVMGANPGHFDSARNPVEQVSWADCQAFCERLTAREQEAGRLPAGHEYRLPTEAEWEYAARGGAQSKGTMYSGSNNLDEVACYGGNSGDRTYLVGYKRANELGLYDLSGNVWEWCRDSYGAYAAGAVVDPTGAAWGVVRVSRGGCWSNFPRSCRVACRGRNVLGNRRRDLGCRLALAPVVQPAVTALVAPTPVPPRAGKGPVAGQPWTVPDLGLKMVWVAPGTFPMGATDGDSDQKPVHQVRLTKGYWLGKYEVTQREWEAVMGNNPSGFKEERNPVVYVRWEDAVAFCKQVTDRERAAGQLPAGYAYRLPTEAEWEYAARGGGQSRGFAYSGSNNLDQVAWYGENSLGVPHPVGQKQPNELGAYDLSGNVGEWCTDWYGTYSAGATVDPAGATTGVNRVHRGCGWLGADRGCRAACRFSYPPADSNNNLGCRLALAVQQ